MSEVAKELALKYLKNKDKTEKEIRMHLAHMKMDADDIEFALEDLMDAGIVDDSRYGRNFVEEAVRKRKGRRLIKAELTFKGLDKDLIAELLIELLPIEVERENAQVEALKTLHEDYTPKNIGKTMQRLMRLGYDQQLIFDVLETLQYRDSSSQD
jgi:regulatory protein